MDISHWLGQDCLSGEISFSFSCTVARSWASPMAAGMMSLVWRYGWMFSWSAWPILISKLAAFNFQGNMTHVHSCRESISVTFSSWGGNMSEWETAWENQRKKAMTNTAWKLLFDKSYFISLVLSLKYAGLIWCLLVFLQPDFLLLNYILPLVVLCSPSFKLF